LFGKQDIVLIQRITMKNCLLYILLMFSLNVLAQKEEGGRKILEEPGIQEILLKASLYEMINSLELNKADADRFSGLYSEYFYEMRKAEKKMPRAQGKLTNEEAEQIIRDEFDQAKRLISVREIYYEKFKKILSQVQILQMYEIERNISRKIIREAEDRRRPPK
jgi:hypothetical protein